MLENESEGSQEKFKRLMFMFKEELSRIKASLEPSQRIKLENHSIDLLHQIQIVIVNVDSDIAHDFLEALEDFMGKILKGKS